MQVGWPAFQVTFTLFRPSKVDDVKIKTYQKWLSMLETQCKKENLKADFDLEDVFFAAREVCESRCAASGERVTGMNLAVWDKSLPVNGKNLLLFAGKYLKNEEQLQDGMKSYPFTDEEKERIAELLERAQKEYNPKTVYITNSDNLH